MIDRIVICPGRFFASQAKVKKLQGNFRKCFCLVRYHNNGTATFSISVEGRRVMSIHIVILQDGRWWVKGVSAVLPSMLRGSNGIVIKDQAEFTKALTIVDHFMKLVSAHDTIATLPGVGERNQGYVKLAEVGIQMIDEEHRFLRASHHARLSKQYGPTGLYLGRSTTCSTRNLTFRAYDKNQQLNERDLSDGNEVATTKVEIVLRNSKELGRRLDGILKKRGATGAATPRSSALQHPAATTLSMNDAYELFKQGLTRVSGIGWLPKNSDLNQIENKNARMLAMGLGDRVTDPLQVERVLAHFKASVAARGTFTPAALDLRNFAMSQIAESIREVIPNDPANISWGDVPWTARHVEWERILRDLDAPEEPDPAISDAWSSSSVLPQHPEFLDLAGAIAPSHLPFIQDLFPA